MTQTTNNEIKELIEKRKLTHWHLLTASLLGSLASQDKMFNQAFLNMLLKHSMKQFIIPYFEGLEEYQQTSNSIPSDGPLTKRLQPVVEFIDDIFELAGKIELSEETDGRVTVTVESAGCRFCPVGVGKAKITPGMTFCPFPTMIEETAAALIGEDSMKTLLHREGMKTHVLSKHDGGCHICYEFQAVVNQ